MPQRPRRIFGDRRLKTYKKETAQSGELCSRLVVLGRKMED
jgi:hypothetical protein